MNKNLFITILLALFPISELRGAIPYAFFNGMPLLYSFAIGVLINALVPFIAMIFLSTLHKWFYRIPIYKQFFDRIIVNARTKVEPKIKKYGYWGLMIFVAIPLPVTGAWTGSVGAWILGLDKKKSCIFVALGVLIAGLIVSTILLTGSSLSSIFIKEINI